MRANNRPSSSSNTNSAAFSPRAIAATTKTMTDQRLSGAGGTEDQRARAGLDAAAEQLVERRDAARHGGAREVRAIFRRHQPRKHIEAAGGDGDIVIAAAEFHAAIFDDARAPPLRAVGRRQFLQPKHAMGDAVHGLVGDIGGEIVEQHHRGAEFREIMLDRQNLPPIAQRALRQQPDFGQAVEHHPARPVRARPLRKSAWWFRRVRGRTNRAGSAAARNPAGFPAAAVRIPRCRRPRSSHGRPRPRAIRARFPTG